MHDTNTLIATSVSLTTAPLSAWKTSMLSILGKYTFADATHQSYKPYQQTGSGITFAIQ